MPDLHAWLTDQVDRVEAVARGHNQWSPDWDHDDLADEIRDRTNAGTVAFVPNPATARHIAANDPAAVLRRCTADRRILDRHSADPGHPGYPACTGCGIEVDFDDPYTDNINDCPELADLAYAHGITDEILAGLDRPEAPKRKRRPGVISLTPKEAP